MHSKPLAKGSTRALRRPLAAALLGAGAVAALIAPGATPAFAQLKPDASIETPYGRAPLSFADIIEKVKPAVVSISVASGGSKAANKKDGPGSGGIPGMPDIPEDHPFHDFFKNLPKEFRGQPNTPRPSQGQGSGFVISQDGYVVTNNHVIDGANKIQVSFDDQEKLDAELVGTDPRTDVALLKIKASGKTFPHVKFSDKPVRVGDWAIAVGNPFGLGGTVTAGIVSALGRDIGSGPYDYLQIDAAVNRGNSGGPTFNLAGEVIGVNTAIYSPSGGNVGIAFAVPAAVAVDVVEQLQNKGSVSRGWLGVKIQNIDEDTRDSLGLAETKGALVSEVTPNGPAADAGFKAQDAILSVNDQKIADSRDLSRKIAAMEPNSTIDVKVWRANAEQSIKVKLGTFPGSSEEIAKLERGDGPDKSDDGPAGVNVEQLGLKLMPARGTGGSADGVAIAEVDADSDAAQKGLKAGDVILKVDGQAVTSPEQVDSGVKSVKGKGLKAVLLSIKSGDATRLVALRFPQS